MTKSKGFIPYGFPLCIFLYTKFAFLFRFDASNLKWVEASNFQWPPEA